MLNWTDVTSTELLNVAKSHVTPVILLNAFKEILRKYFKGRIKDTTFRKKNQKQFIDSIAIYRFFELYILSPLHTLKQN